MALKVRQNADTFNSHHRQGGVYPLQNLCASKSTHTVLHLNWTHVTKIRKRKLSYFLSKPQAWYIIDARSAAHIIKGGSPPLYLITRQRASFLRLDDIPQQVADDIQHFVLMIYTPSA